MNHRFYQKSKSEQIRIQIIVAVIAGIVILLMIFLSWLLKFYLLSMLAFSIILSIVAPFFDTPSLKNSGKLIYYSSLFIAEKPKNGEIVIHGGTLFDYVFVLNNQMNGKERTNFIIQKYLEGLLSLLSDYENEKLSNYTIKGTSYILNKRTSEKLGFDIVKTDYIQKLILLYNFFNLLISNSLAKAKLTIPDLKNIHTYEAELSTLISRKAYIEALNNKLKKSIDNKKAINEEVQRYSAV